MDKMCVHSVCMHNASMYRHNAWKRKRKSEEACLFKKLLLVLLFKKGYHTNGNGLVNSGAVKNTVKPSQQENEESEEEEEISFMCKKCDFMRKYCHDISRHHLMTYWNINNNKLK